MRTFHHGKLTGGDTCDGLQWFAMLLEAQNHRKMAHFIAPCGRVYTTYWEAGYDSMR